MALKKEKYPLEGFRQRLLKQLEAQGKVPKHASLEAGVGGAFISNVVAGRDPQLSYIAAVARKHRLSLDALLDLPTGERAAAQPIRVVGEVRAGHWQEVSGEDDFIVDDSPFPPDPRFPAEAQFDLIVRGTSINRFARDGERLRCVDIEKAGLRPSEGDLVIFQKTREGGHLVETTAKRFRQRGSIIELLPDSDDPKWQPERIDVRKASEGERGKIVAIVLYSYSPASHAGWR